MASTAFLGLGRMGYPMAGNLIKKGHEVTVYNRTVATSEKWLAEFGGKMAHSPAEAARHADFVLCCVSADKAVEEICTGQDGAFNAMKPGSLFIDHSSITPSLSKILAGQAEEHGIGFVDAPVSGGDHAARAGNLTIMAGASEGNWAKASALFEAYAAKLFHMGPVGTGQAVKMINQIIVSGIAQITAEGLRLMEATGLSSDRALDVLLNGSACSKVLEHRAAAMLAREFSPGFTVDLMLKDLDIGLDEAKKHNIDLPVAGHVANYLKDLQGTEMGSADMTCLISRL